MRYALIFGMTLGLSILFQVYWTAVLVEDNVLYILGGGAERFLLKLVSLSLIYASLYKSFSIKALRYNLVWKISLLYWIATVIVVLPFIYSNPYIQAFNLVLFFPLLCIDFRGERGEEIFTQLAKIIVCVVCLHIVIDLSLKLFGFSLVRTLLGGMGNANTFGLYLIVAGLGLRFIYQKNLLSNIVLLSIWGTGSLACTLIASVFVLQSVIINLWKNTLGSAFLLVSAATFLVFFGEDSLFFGEDILFGDFGSTQHAFMKVKGLIEIIFTGSAGEVGVGSIEGRQEFMMQAIQMLSDHPISLIFGHPDFIPFYSGDGFHIALLVTIGLPATILFFISHLVAIYRGLRENKPLSNFAAYTLVTLTLLLFSNRILDYWPAGLIYMVVMAYLLRDRTSSTFN
jgi:hypothetical protein